MKIIVHLQTSATVKEINCLIDTLLKERISGAVYLEVEKPSRPISVLDVCPAVIDGKHDWYIFGNGKVCLHCGKNR